MTEREPVEPDVHSGSDEQTSRRAPAESRGSFRQGLQIALCLHAGALLLGTILFELPRESAGEAPPLFEGLGYSFYLAALVAGWIQLFYLIPLAGLFGKRQLTATRDGILIYAALACLIPTGCLGLS